MKLLCALGADTAVWAPNGDSALTVLLKCASKKQKELCTYMLLLSSGCPVQQRDLQLMNSHPILKSRGVHDYATRLSARPSQLKHLCKLTPQTGSQTTDN